ncbi:MAG: hypothetical protein LBL58_08240 [Tannerellaceae bacterium]|jgi:hypothetical protein|nr:hypothetical protein [Tannerellaceae bacterium]
MIAERGMYNATDAEMIAAKASNLKKELLKVKGLDLIGRMSICIIWTGTNQRSTTLTYKSLW